MVYDAQDGMSRCGRCGQAHIGLGSLCDACEHRSQKGRFCDGPPTTPSDELEDIAADLDKVATLNHSEAMSLNDCIRRVRLVAERLERRALNRLAADIAAPANDHAPCESEGGA